MLSYGQLLLVLLLAMSFALSSFKGRILSLKKQGKSLISFIRYIQLSLLISDYFKDVASIWRLLIGINRDIAIICFPFNSVTPFAGKINLVNKPDIATDFFISKVLPFSSIALILGRVWSPMWTSLSHRTPFISHGSHFCPVNFG